MSRSIKKGPFVDARLLRRVAAQKSSGDREPLRTWRRACTIVPEFVDHTFLVHQGKTFVKVYVTEDMVGHKLGEFAPTRIFRGHGGTKKATAGAPGAPAAPGAAAPAAPAKGGG